jgi:hypothetical protein
VGLDPPLKRDASIAKNKYQNPEDIFHLRYGSRNRRYPNCRPASASLIRPNVWARCPAMDTTCGDQRCEAGKTCRIGSCVGLVPVARKGPKPWKKDSRLPRSKTFFDPSRVQSLATGASPISRHCGTYKPPLQNHLNLPHPDFSYGAPTHDAHQQQRRPSQSPPSRASRHHSDHCDGRITKMAKPCEF